MVLVIADYDLPEPFTNLGHRRVPLPLQLHLDGLELSDQTLLRRFAPDCEGPVLALPTMMREAQKREGFRFSLAAPFPIEGREPPELDQPCLFRIQFQPELREPLPKCCQEPLRIRSVFEG